MPGWKKQPDHDRPSDPQAGGVPLYRFAAAFSHFVLRPPRRSPARWTLPDLGMPRLVFLNGVFSAAQSSSFPYVQPFATVRGEVGTCRCR